MSTPTIDKSIPGWHLTPNKYADGSTTPSPTASSISQASQSSGRSNFYVEQGGNKVVSTPEGGVITYSPSGHVLSSKTAAQVQIESSIQQQGGTVTSSVQNQIAEGLQNQTRDALAGKQTQPFTINVPEGTVQASGGQTAQSMAGAVGSVIKRSEIPLATGAGRVSRTVQSSNPFISGRTVDNSGLVQLSSGRTSFLGPNDAAVLKGAGVPEPIVLQMSDGSNVTVSPSKRIGSNLYLWNTPAGQITAGANIESIVNGINKKIRLDIERQVEAENVRERKLQAIREGAEKKWESSPFRNTIADIIPGVRDVRRIAQLGSLGGASTDYIGYTVTENINKGAKVLGFNEPFKNQKTPKKVAVKKFAEIERVKQGIDNPTLNIPFTNIKVLEGVPASFVTNAADNIVIQTASTYLGGRALATVIGAAKAGALGNTVSKIVTNPLAGKAAYTAGLGMTGMYGIGVAQNIAASIQKNEIGSAVGSIIQAGSNIGAGWAGFKSGTKTSSTTNKPKVQLGESTEFSQDVVINGIKRQVAFRQTSGIIKIGKNKIANVQVSSNIIEATPQNPVRIEISPGKFQTFTKGSFAQSDVNLIGLNGKVASFKTVGKSGQVSEQILSQLTTPQGTLTSSRTGYVTESFSRRQNPSIVQRLKGNKPVRQGALTTVDIQELSPAVKPSGEFYQGTKYPGRGSSRSVMQMEVDSFYKGTAKSVSNMAGDITASIDRFSGVKAAKPSASTFSINRVTAGKLGPSTVQVQRPVSGAKSIASTLSRDVQRLAESTIKEMSGRTSIAAKVGSSTKKVMLSPSVIGAGIAAQASRMIAVGAYATKPISATVTKKPIATIERIKPVVVAVPAQATAQRQKLAQPQPSAILLTTKPPATPVRPVIAPPAIRYPGGYATPFSAVNAAISGSSSALNAAQLSIQRRMMEASQLLGIVPAVNTGNVGRMSKSSIGATKNTGIPTGSATGGRIRFASPNHPLRSATSATQTSSRLRFASPVHPMRSDIVGSAMNNVNASLDAAMKRIKV